MTNMDLVLQQVELIRMQALATAATASAIAAALTGIQAEPMRESHGDYGCDHALRVPAAVMGDPGAWVCGACGATGSGRGEAEDA